MGTTAEKLAYLADTKTDIKNAIVAKGVEVPEGTTFREYADLIAGISAGADTTLSSGEVNPDLAVKFYNYAFTIPVENTQALFVCVGISSNEFSVFALSLPDGGYYKSAAYGALSIDISRGLSEATISGTSGDDNTLKYYYVQISYKN